MQCNAKANMRATAPKVARQAVTFKPAVARPANKTTRVVKASATANPQSAAAAAAAAAAVLLASSPVIASELPSTFQFNPAAEVAVSSKSDVEGIGAKFNKFLNKVIVDPTSKINEDAFGADRKQDSTVGDTKRPIPIPTEQEAVAPEAFPNPASNIAPEPPVLSGALGDEQYGPNANQFKGLTEGDRQRLIDEKSPAQSSN